MFETVLVIGVVLVIIIVITLALLAFILDDVIEFVCDVIGTFFNFLVDIFFFFIPGRSRQRRTSRRNTGDGWGGPSAYDDIDFDD